MITLDQLTELERLEKAATKGPWKMLSINGNCNCDECCAEGEDLPHHVDGYIPAACNVEGPDGDYMSRENASCAAAARNALPALIAAARQALRTCEWKDAVDEHSYWLLDGEHKEEIRVKHTECGNVIHINCRSGQYCAFCGGLIVTKESK